MDGTREFILDQIVAWVKGQEDVDRRTPYWI